jgi:hypothetical protein
MDYLIISSSLFPPSSDQRLDDGSATLTIVLSRSELLNQTSGEWCGGYPREPSVKKKWPSFGLLRSEVPPRQGSQGG